jgi:hypothetical protein
MRRDACTASAAAEAVVATEVISHRVWIDLPSIGMPTAAPVPTTWLVAQGAANSVAWFRCGRAQRWKEKL